MNHNDQPGKIPNNTYIHRLLYEWFVKYNPLYFISAACFVFGVFLVSKGMHNINWIDGQIILTAVIESYEILLLAGSFILYRVFAQTRPAVVLAIMNIFFLFDCTYQTEHLSSIPYYGAISTVFWILLFALKLKALVWIFQLKLPLVGFLTAISSACGIAAAPYLLYYSSIDVSVIHLIMTWHGVVIVVLFLWFRPVVMYKNALDAKSKKHLGRISRAAWMIWAGFYLFHLISWIRFFDIDINLANIAPIFIILAFVTEDEISAWVGGVLTIIFSLSNPSMFWLAALASSLVFLLKGFKNGQSRLYIGTVLALHMSLLAAGWQHYPFPDPPLWLAISAALSLLAIAWIFRLTSSFSIALLGAAAFWNPRGPRDILEWGTLFIAVGFTTLVAGIIMNWKLRLIYLKQENGQVTPPSQGPSNSPSADILRRARDRRQERKRLLRDLRDDCPYCKFNLKTGKGKCDQCGKEFY
ncbi:MAG: hypothetical protein PVI06_14020 [Desulfobacterales bacterium]